MFEKCTSNNIVKILSWNINGVGSKFDKPVINNFITNFDIMIVMETHFKTRYKDVDGFELVCRSASSSAGRGGVALYLNSLCDLKLHILDNDHCDSVCVEILQYDIILLAPYITPSNSKYYNNSLFQYIKFVADFYKEKNVFIIGDLNCRINIPTNIDPLKLYYKPNPDPVTNENGKRMIDLCEKNKLIAINGLVSDKVNCDTDFTWFRANLKSQNDWAFCNSTNCIHKFSILNKYEVSDHKPICLELGLTKHTLNTDFIKDISIGNFSYDHHDSSHFIKKPMKLHNLDLPKILPELYSLANSLNECLSADEIDINNICDLFNTNLYESCKKHSCSVEDVVIPSHKMHLNSSNFYAISNVNKFMMDKYLNDNASYDAIYPYLIEWQLNLKYGKKKESDEFNCRVNKNWKFLQKNNSKLMWKKIAWKEKKCTNQAVDQSIITDYFTEIFQNPRLLSNPTIHDVKNIIHCYDNVVPALDNPFNLSELNVAITNVSKGIGLDSIDKDICKIFPYVLRTAILNMFNHIFLNSYPDCWSNLFLRPEIKKGHTFKKPKLRGIAISSMMPAIYDSMMNNRFQQWTPLNPEQAGFKHGQGCMLQIFSLYLLMELSRANDTSIFIGFIDYEKAFDFVSRGQIALDLIDNSAGKNFVNAIANMYDRNFYVPKVRNNKLANPIKSVHGVTQGRQSSTTIFNFEVKDLPANVCIHNNFINVNCLQLADDSALITESLSDLQDAFSQAFEFSSKKYMYINYDKTVYLHLDSNPIHEDIVIDNDTTISAAERLEHVYLGITFIASNNIIQHIKKNFSKREFNICKYYEWLHLNHETPFQIKLHVLYSCFFSTYLYGVEAWFKISKFSNKLLSLERKFLKSLLGVKSGTTNELIYLEIHRNDIMNVIESRQIKFARKLLTLTDSDAIVKKVLYACRNLEVHKYYSDLQNASCTPINDIAIRINSIQNQSSTHISRYKNLINTDLNHIIYESFLPEKLRVTITRWRLSSHDLNIEIGRHKHIPRENRFCPNCLNSIEDEEHVIYHCPIYNTIRSKYATHLEKYSDVKSIFNPVNKEDAIVLGNLLLEIENCRR